MKKLFLHMPKCAGLSILDVLMESVPQLVKKDYETYFSIPKHKRNKAILNNLLEPREARDDIITYGHFFPVKYIGSNLCQEFKLVTILRDPVDRLVSHYKHWASCELPHHYLWRRMKYENWSFEDFAFCEEMRDFYSQYFSYLSLGSFSYIGLFEDLDLSIKHCFKTLDIPYALNRPLPVVNASQSNIEIELPEALVASLHEYHSNDYVIYNFAREKFHS